MLQLKVVTKEVFWRQRKAVEKYMCRELGDFVQVVIVIKMII